MRIKVTLNKRDLMGIDAIFLGQKEDYENCVAISFSNMGIYGEMQGKVPVELLGLCSNCVVRRYFFLELRNWHED